MADYGLRATRVCRRELGQHGVRHLEVGIDVLHVVVVLQGGDQPEHGGGLLLVQGRRQSRLPHRLGRGGLSQLGVERGRYSAQVFERARNKVAVSIGFHIVGAGLDRRLQDGIGGARRCRIADLADMREHVRDRSGRAEVAAVLGEHRADGTAGAVAVIGERLHDYRHATGAVALIANRVIALGIASGGLLDGAFDIVLGHVLRACRLHRQAQPRVHVGIGRAGLGRHGNLPRELGEQLGAHRILAPLAVHDVLELRMASHGLERLLGEVAGRQASGRAAP